MALPTLASLLAPPSADQVKASLLSLLQAQGFPVTDWQEGGVARTLVEMIAKSIAELNKLVALIAASGFVAFSSGKWLTLVAAQVYALNRNAATFTVGTVVLTDSANAGPFTVAPGQLWFGATDGKRFTNTTGGALPKGGTLSLSVQAESPGSAYNVPTGAVTTLLTPLPGVTVANPYQLGQVVHVGSGTGTVTPSGSPQVAAQVVVKITQGGPAAQATCSIATDGVTFGAPNSMANPIILLGTGIALAFSGNFVAGDSYAFSTSWISQSGTDQEPDSSLQSRCLARWPSLGVAPNADVYDLWARTAAPQVTRTRVSPGATIPGRADLYLATASGPADAATVAAVDAYIEPRIPLTSTVSVASAIPIGVMVEATLYIQNGYQQAALAQATDNLMAYVNGAPIGGTIYLSDLIAALQEPEGIRNVVLASPAADIVLNSTQVATLAQNLSVVVI
jgi:phage-related baseplate assembly protein